MTSALHRAVGPLRRLRDRLVLRHLRWEERAAFYDVEATAPELRRIDAGLDVIRAELRAVLPRTIDMPLYHDVDESQKEISGAGPGNWRVLFLYHWGARRALPNARLCPRTVELIESVPNVLQAFFSILEPGKSVPAHRGPTLGTLRYHTALHVPEENPPSIRVKDRRYTWKVGESLLFDDSLEHEVFNESDDVRVVLIVDVMRPLPLPLHLLNDAVRRLTRATIPDESRDEVFERMQVD
jgi:aspartyl/asparaginyl beta-hydroxylase (cupin superfamily)